MSRLIERDDVSEMLAGENSGISRDTLAQIAAQARAGLEHPFHSCARPPFAF